MTQNKKIIIFSIVTFLVFSTASFSYAGLDDFDVSNNVVELGEFLSGGPSKDGIPALTNPEFMTVDEALYLDDEDLVVGVSINGESRAYPFRILNWHEIVNDVVANQPVAVTFCPLTKSAFVFDRKLDEQTLEFGVSGLLYNSNVVMYDRNSSGLWSQMYTGGLTGKHSKEKLNIVPSVVMTWQEWIRQHPQTLVLSKNTGHWRNYSNDPYRGYHSSREIMFNIGRRDIRLPDKELVIGIKIKNTARAYPIEDINKLNEPLMDNIEGVDIKVHKAGNREAAYITDKDGKLLPAVVAYWFAWSTFNKNTEVYQN